jgi:hypothetical protein
MLADVVNCPALLLFENEIKTKVISKDYLRELDGVDDLDGWLGDKILRSDMNVRIPFIKGILEELKEGLLDSTMAYTVASDIM